MKRIRALVVDDSATMRGLISAVLRRDPEIEVVGGAGDPLEARRVIKELNPDVITLDVEMPNMNGIEFLEKLMRLRPMPVVMVSTLTQAGADITLRALEIGAVDCVAKPSHGEGSAGFGDLAEKVKVAARARVRNGEERAAHARPASYSANGRVVAIGSSTGGVEALISILGAFPADCPPTLITQHMPPSFTRSFAERLDRLCAAHVQEATDGAEIGVGKIFLAPGGRHLELSGRRCRLHDQELVSGHRPSVDVLFHSVAKVAGADAVGVILTGMGADGARGLLEMREAGATTLGQDEASCVVYGMPKVANEIGAVQTQLPLNRIAGAILRHCALNPVEAR